MKRWAWISGFLIVMVLALFAFGAGAPVAASDLEQQKSSLRLGGELYDNWVATLDMQPPSGDNPMWSRQTTNPLSGADTWRCVTCHGWDYQGKDGAYRAGSNATGFPGLLAASTKSPQTIMDQLSGKIDPAHNFGSLMDADSLNALVEFITKGLIDDNQFINPVSLEVIDGDTTEGKRLYEEVCAACHGKDGTAIKLRFEDLDGTMGTLATLDPWRFLHKTRYGTPGTLMAKVVGVDQQWTPQQGRDVLLYAQTLPTGLTKPTLPAALEGRQGTPAGVLGGPAQDWPTSLLSAFGAIASSLGFALLVGFSLIGVLLVLVWVMRGSKK